MRDVPRPQGRVVRGRHRMDPLLPQPVRPSLRRTRSGCATTSAASCRARSSASTRWRATSRDPVRAQDPPRHRHRHHRLGVRLPALRLPLARRARARAGRARRGRRAGRRDRPRSPGATPAATSGGTRSPCCPARRRPWARSAPCHPTSTRPPCRGPSGASATSSDRRADRSILRLGPPGAVRSR